MKHVWRPYAEAKAFVHTLGLNSRQEWRDYCHSGLRPADIPSNPYEVYGEEFEGMGRWIGSGTCSNRNREFLPFVQARTFVRSLKLKSGTQWKAYCRSSNKPSDIPADPRNVYRDAFVSMGDWLGTNVVASHSKTYCPFPVARAFVRTLGLGNEEEWKAYCRSGNKPDDIPAAPRQVYGSVFVSLGDWLGTDRVASCKQLFRPFEEARAHVRALELRGYEEWKVYCRSGQKPKDIPAKPDRKYKSDFKGWGDWLGTGTIANFNRVYRPFPEARAFVQSLGLRNEEEWKAYCRSGNKPNDIPARPSQVYGQAFTSLGDWLGTSTVASSKRVYCDFVAARAFVRSLGLKNQQEWFAYCHSGQKPANIPTNPHRTYRALFRGMADWLGTTKKWKRTALLRLLEDLRPHLGSLQERELYVILQQGGALPALRLALGETSVLAVLRRILVQEEQAIQTLQTLTDDHLAVRVQESEMSSDGVVPELLEANLQALLSVAFDESHQCTTTGSEVTLIQRREQLHLVDHLAHLPGGLDDEAVDYLVTSRVSSLWEIYSHEGREAIDRLLTGEEGDQFFLEIKHRFLAELESVEHLDWTEGWAFTANGNLAPPNTMQRRIAWMVREYRRIGNWSGVGAGKTISALLSSRVSHTPLTLIITNYSTITGWVQSISNVYPDSQVCTDPQAIAPSDPHQYHYLLLNYEKFQGAGRHQLVQHLLTLGIQFIVLDEIQLVKQRERQISQRSKAVETLIRKASESNADLRVLAMSATPIVFSRVGSPLKMPTPALLGVDCV